MKETISLPLGGIKARKSDPRVLIAKGLSLLFSAQVSTAVLVAAALLVWWHIATAPGTLAAQRAAGIDAMLLTPWLSAWAVRSLTSAKKGGEL